MSVKKEPAEISPFLGVPLLLGVAVLSIPYGVALVVWLAIRERRLFRRLSLRNRTIDWLRVEQHLAAGQGTLIIEQAQKESCRLWWTSDDVRLVSPLKIPAFDDLDFIRADPTEPFVAWCFGRYLSAETGCALLSRPKGMSLPRGFVSSDFFTGIFPAAQVVATTLTR